MQKNIMQNISAGILTSVLVISGSIAATAIIFFPPLTNYFGIGIILCLLSLIVSNIVLSWKSTFPFAVSWVGSASNAILATAITASALDLTTIHKDESILPTTLTIVALSTFFTGAFCYILGYYKLAKFIRYIPYPVLGGFVASVGCIIIKKGYSLLLKDIIFTENIFNLTSILLIVLATSYACFIVYVNRKKLDIFLVPASLILLIFVNYWFLGPYLINTLQIVSTNQWMIVIPNGSFELMPSLTNFFHDVSWANILKSTPIIFIAALTLIIIHLLNIIAIEEKCSISVELDHELKTIGVANMSSGFFGGFNNQVSFAMSLFNFRLGGNSYIAGITISVCCALFVIGGPIVFNFLPKFILTAMLISVGFNFLYEWLIQSWSKLPLFDYLQIIAMVILANTVNIMWTLALGILLSCLKFIIQASALKPIKLNISGNNYSSSVIRPYPDQMKLNEVGEKIQIIKLQGILFFGFAIYLYNQIIKTIVKNAHIKYIIIDFFNVPSVDTSARSSFLKLQEKLQQKNIEIILTAFTPNIYKLFNQVGLLNKKNVIVLDNLDIALQRCETNLLEYRQSDAVCVRGF